MPQKSKQLDWRPIAIATLSFLAMLCPLGCTPTDSQTSSFDPGAFAGMLIQSALDFAISFGRQALAAFLF